MKQHPRFSRTTGLALAATLAVSFGVSGSGCGGDGGGGGPSSTIEGNVSGAGSSAALERSDRGWLAWAGETVFGIFPVAHAQNPFEGIEVCARNGGRRSCAPTDSSGDFRIPNAPTGDVTLAFDGESCRSSFALPDVPRNSTVRVVDFDCAQGRAERVEEIFEAIVRNVPGSAQGNIDVCVVITEADHKNRVVKTDTGTTFEDSSAQEPETDDQGNPLELDACDGEAAATFADVAEGDRVTVVGVREGADPNFRSAVNASCFDVQERGLEDPCDAEGEEEENLES